MFFHGTPRSFEPGQRLLPPGRTGVPVVTEVTGSLAAAIANAGPPTSAFRDGVFLSTNPWISLLFSGDDCGGVYEVDPEGALQRDHDPNYVAPAWSASTWRCSAA